MPITVRGPDGAILNFPDGTSQEEMRRAMISRYGPPGENQRGSDYRARFNPTPQEVEQQRQDVQAQADSNVVTQGIGAAYGALNRFRNVLPNSVRVLADTVAGVEAVRVRARNGDAERDFQQNDGFLDRSGSLLERSVASAVGGLDRTTGTVLPGRLGRTFQSRARDMESTANRAVAGETTWDDVKADPFTNILPYIYETAVGSSVEMGITAMPGGLAAESTIQAGRIGQQRAQNDGRRDATLADVGIGALFGIPSTYLERLGITSIFSGAAKTAAGRIASATAVEAGTEAAQSSLEYTGGTIGTAQGWDATEMLDQAAAGAVGGGGMGGAIRTTVEAADAVGNRMRRPRAPISAQDQASPLPDDLIAEGRAATGLAADGPAMPQPGGRVVVTAPTGEQRAGVFQGITRGDDGSALVTIQMDDGRTISQPADILADAGFQVRPEQDGGPIDYAAGADAVDAQLADAAQRALQQAQQGTAATPSTSVLPAPAAPAPAAGSAPVTGDGREQFKARVRRSESGGNDRARNPNGSASGRYQFIESTFKTLYQRVYGGTAADAAAAWNSDRRYAPEVQERLMDAAINEYEQVYSRAGITPTAGNLYLAHFFGPQMAARVLQAPRGADIGSIVGEAAVAANERVLRGKTVADVIAWTDRAMGGAGAVDGGGTAQPGYQAQPGTQFTDMADPAAPARLTREPVNFIAEDRADTAVTTTGREVPVRYAVAELSDLVASNDIDGNPNPDFPAARQPRDRTRAASRAQIQEIATKLNPRLLGRSPKASDGAPIVSIDGVVESGNGRTIALQAAYAAGGERIDAYRQMIEAEGFDTSGMQQPVLVRVRDPNMSEADVQSFIREANQRDTAAMSGTESAEADASAMPASLLDLYRGGDIDAASNRDFVRGFMQAVIPSSEHGQMVMPDGAIAKPLLSRIEAALLVRAFGRQPFIGKLVDATDNDIRAIGKALIETAGAVAQLRQAAAEGRIDPAMDISANIAEAVEIVDRARREKKPITDYVNQRDIFSGETVDPMTEAVLRLFFARPDFTKPVGQARLVERIGFYLAEAEKSVPGGGLLGPSTATGPGDILALANDREARPDGSEQPDLLRTSQGVPDAGNGGDVRPDRRDDQRPAGEGVQPQAGEGSGGQGVAPATPAKQPPIVRYRAEAAKIEAGLPPVAAGKTRLWRGNRKGENGKATRFTNDLPGIALPFAEGYGGDVTYVDVSTADLQSYLNDGAAAEDAEFNLPADVAARARPVNGTAPEAQSQARVEDTGTGKSVAIIGASEAELAAVASVIPNAKPLKRKDGATVYSKKYEDKIRAALVDKSAGNSRPVAEAPAQPNAKNEPETQPTETPVRRVMVNTVGADGLTEAERNAMAAKRGWPPFGPMVRDIVGEDIDKDWTAFSTKSNTLGIPRADMPQIKSAHRGALINFLNARGIEHEEFESQPSALWPTQAEFSPAKVKQAIDYDFGDRAILISKEGYVVDGHHQWLAALWQQTGRGDREHDVRTIQLKAPIRELLAAIAEFPSVQKSKGATGGGSVDLVYVSKAGTQVKNLVPGRDDRRGEIEVQTDALLPRAERNQKVLDQFGADIPGWQSPGVKSRDRIVEKVLTEGYASPLALKDVVRGAAVVDTMADADRIAAQVTGRFTVVEDKGWQTLSSGYVDRKIIVAIDGVRAEVQIVPRVVWDAKKNGANALYKQYRVAGTEAAKDRLQSEMQAVYAAALAGSDFASVSSAAKSTSLNAAPASRGESGTPSLSASAGAETQSASDRPSPSQTNAEGGTRENTATSRPSTSNSDGAGIASTSEPQVGANREESNKGPSPNRLVTDERAAELRARLKAKLNPNRLNAGIDPEIIAIGSELAVYHIEKGARRFTAFARAIAADLGMGVKDLRQYLRGWYNGSRDMLEDMGESVAGMDTPDEVARAMRTLDQWADEAPADQVTPPADSATGATDGLQGSLFDGDAGAGARDVPVSAQDRGAGSAPQSQDAGSVQPPRSADGERAQAAERGGARPAGPGVGRADGAAATDRVPGGTEPSVTPTNWRIEPNSLAEFRKPMEKAEDNVRAIEIVKRLQEDGRAATPEEQAQIALYVGWGGLANAFPRTDGSWANAGMQRVGLRLKELLTKEEYDTARRSTQYAHYTSEKVVRPMWELARRLGFNGGTVFEPGMGTGNFAGMMPPDLAAVTSYQGLEYDRLTAQIAKALYPAWGVRQDDYTKTPRIVDQFDLAIGNPPFSRTVISGDPYYGKMGFLLHDFFFAKTLDALRPGGLLLFVTSAGTMNKADTKAREYLADRADLVGAVRLPSTAFAENAGTEVTTDIIVLRKRPVGAPAGDRSWTETVQMPMPDRDGNMTVGTVNRYFADNPAMILGEQGMFDKLVAGPRYAVRATPGTDLEQALRAALDTMEVRHTIAAHANTVAPAPAVDPAPDAPAVDFMVTEQKEGSFYLKDGDLYRLEGGVGRKVQSPGKGVTGGVSKDAQAKIRRLIGIRDALRATLLGDLSGDAAASEKARADLNRSYDDFVAAFGPINKTDIRYQRPSIIQQEGARAKAREEARANGLPWDEGSFDATPLYDADASTGEIARARQQAREAAKAAGRPFDEGSFNPEDLDDVPIIKRPNIDPFMSDQEGYRLRSIEHFNEDTGVAKKGLVFFENPVAREAKPAIASPEDALLYVMAMQGWPDIAEIARLAGTSEADTLAALKGYLFKVPGTDVYETRETYLSGNVRDKLDVARRALEGDETLAHNVEALEAVQPEPLSRVEIAVQLGMPWVPTAVIEKFGTEALGLSSLRVSYNAKLARYSVSGDDRSAAATTDWGTQKREAPYLVADALNRNSPKIYVKRSDGSSELDSAATQEAQDKIFAIKARFREWVWEDEQRALELESLYNREYNNLVAPVFDGSYLKTPGINAKWRWRPHQSAVVARIIQTGNTYMAHGVGAGKTSAMIGAGMEMKRLGLVKKPMYAVPNHMLGQFTKEFYEQYPTARIMVADETRFHTSRRKQFVADVANSDIDAVIITHSAFGLLPVSAEFENSLLDEQIADLRSALEEIDGDQSNRVTIKQLEQQIEQLEQRQQVLRNRKKDAVYTFEETGVDFLFVDEAHLFRKLGFATKMGQVKGIDPNGAQSSFDLFAKIQLLESRTPGRSVVLASGTPITNTMAELYTVQRYMQRGMLRAKGLERFDAWAGSFGDTDTKLEQDPAGGYKPVTRFAKFVNVPELSVMVRQFMDVVTSQELEALVVRPKLKGGKRNMVVVEQTDRQRNYQDSLRERMVAIQARKGPPAPGDDILLSVINDGRKAAIDMRLIDRDNPKEDSKLERLVANVYRIWQESKRQPFHAIEADGYSAKPVDFGPATQMVFADLGVNETEGKDGSRGISVHDYIRAQLIQRGVPQREIALISNFKNAVQRQRLFNDMNDGRVRILIGSVPKMGTGVNAQQRLLANHNLDAQWYPANDEQRNGRIIRQGNMNPEVEIYDYSTKGTYDSTMWGLMENKARFIEGFMRGDPTMRDMEDLGEASQYEQAKAMTTSDPRMMVLTELRQSLEKAELRKQAFDRAQAGLRRKLAQANENKRDYTKRIAEIEADIAQRVTVKGDAFEAQADGVTFTERAAFGEALLVRMDRMAAEKKITGKTTVIGKMGGFDLAAQAFAFAGKVDVELYLVRNGTLDTIPESNSALGLVQSIASRLGRFEDNLAFAKNELARAEQQLVEFAGRGNETFAGQAEIDDLYRQVTDLESELAAESNKDAKESRPDDLFAEPAQPERTMTDRQRAELEARQKQGMSRRGAQQGLGDQEGGLFGAERAQGSLFSRGGTKGRLRSTDGAVTGQPITFEAFHGSFADIGVFDSAKRGQSTGTASAKQAFWFTDRRKTAEYYRQISTYQENMYRPKSDKLSGAVLRRTITMRNPLVVDNGGKVYREESFASIIERAKAAGHDGVIIKRAYDTGELNRFDAMMRGRFGSETLYAVFDAAQISGADVQLQARLKALGLSDKVTLRVVETLDGAAGDYRGGGAAVMRVAMDTRQDGMFTLDHEAIHALRGAGLFTASEWSLLTAAARRDEKTMASIRRRYADLDPEAQLEEAVADRFAAWARGERQAGALARLFQRIADVLTAIRNALTGAGFDSANAVMRRIDRGDVGSREGIASQGEVQQSRVTQELDLTEYVADSPTGRLGQMLDRVRVKLQDRYLPLLRVQQRVESAIGRPLPQVANPYVREELMTGRIGAKLDRLSKDMIDPLFVAMHQAGVSVDELETYLYARHAPERNAQIAKINPELPDGGSGMSDIEAAALINRMDQAGKLDAIKAIADMVDGIRDYALRLRTESGLLSADEAKAWRDTYENYVPLRGREEVEGDATGLTERVRRAGGINVRGKESRRAFGRRSKADNILAYTLLQAEEAIVRSETNRVAQAFVNMVRLAPDPEFWQVEKVTRKAVLDSTTGMVRYENQTRVQAEDKDWTVAAKFGGEEVRVTMERTNPSARRLATAMKRLTEHQLDWVVQYLGIPTRFLSAVNTSWNPEFIITNAFRDLQSALVNLTGEQRAGLVGGVARDYRKALVASTKGAFGKGEGEWARWYKEMTDEGGRVFFNRIDDLDALKKRVQEGMTRAEGKLTLKRGLIAVRDFVEAANNGVENAVRLATYKNARELGLSKQEAASLAKNVTVNFNRRGELGAGLNAFYMFFNASVQGSVRILTAMRSKRVRQILAGVAVGSFMLELLNAMLSDDDDDGESYYDKISAFDKNRNIVIMLPGEGGRHIKIPMPYGYNVFASLGRTSAEIIRRGGDGAMTSASDFVTAVVDAFNPVGGTESLLNFISPTLVDPIVDLMRNRDYADRPIMPEANAYGPQEPDAQRYFGSVGPQWRAITDALTAMTGGDDVVAGAIDVSPETLEYLSGTVFGAAGAFLDRQISLGAKILDGDPATAVEASDLPMARKVFASKPSWYDRSAYYDRMSQVEQAVSNAGDYLERQDVQRFESYVNANRQLLTLEPAMKEARRTMRQLRAARGEAELANRLGRLDDAGYQRIRNQVRDQEEVIIRQFNTLWNATMHPPEEQ